MRVDRVSCIVDVELLGWKVSRWLAKFSAFSVFVMAVPRSNSRGGILALSPLYECSGHLPEEVFGGQFFDFSIPNFVVVQVEFFLDFICYSV